MIEERKNGMQERRGNRLNNSLELRNLFRSVVSNAIQTFSKHKLH